MLKFHGMCDFVLFWRSNVLISPIGKKICDINKRTNLENMWHQYYNRLFQFMSRKHVSCPKKLSHLVLSWDCVCVRAWGIFMCDKPARHGMWLHAVLCICSSVSYWCDADSSFHESKINRILKYLHNTSTIFLILIERAVI